MKKLLCSFCLSLGFAPLAQALLSEPDNVLYGLVYAGTNQLAQITAAETNVVIEARATPAGPALATYRMGSRPALGDFYSLRLSLESIQPIAGIQSFQAGAVVYLTVTDPQGMRGQQSFVVVGRGQLARLDLGLSNFPPDWLARLRHPADISPADNAISFAELEAYTTAWKSGQTWPLDPNPVPVGYVTRAGALFLGGGTYVFDPSQVTAAPSNAPLWWATNAPLWWINAVPVTPPPPGNTVVRAVSSVFQPGVPMTVTATVTCGPGVGVYAVEDQPPAGWQVSNISDGGAFDPLGQKVKWGLFFDNTARVLSYTLTPPGGAATDANFTGQAGFDGQLVAITGSDETGPPTTPGLVSLFAPGYVRGSGFMLKLQGVPGDAQIVETSTNLVDWTQLTNIVLDSTGLGQVTDSAATNDLHRFYRTRASD